MSKRKKINYRKIEMKKLLFIPVILISFICSYGCSDDYNAEKEMWYAQKAATQVMANPESTPPGQVELVAQKFRRIIKKYPDWSGLVKAQWSIAQVYIANKNYTQAEDELKKIIAEHSENKELCAQMEATIGSLYEMQNDWKKALTIYNEVIQKYPDTSQGLSMPLYLAERYRNLEEFPKAETAYHEAISKYQIVFNTSSKRVKALTLGLYIKAQLALASLYEQQDRWTEALNILHKVMSEHPYSRDGLEIPLYIARHYKTRGDKEQTNIAITNALNYYQDIHEKNEENPLGLIALNLMTTAYLNQENWTKAIETQNKIIEKYPDSPGIPLSLLNIGVLYEQALNDKDKAISTYEELIKKYPKHRLAKESRKRIKELEKKKDFGDDKS